MVQVLLASAEFAALMQNCMVWVQQKQEQMIRLAVAAQSVVHTVLGHPVTLSPLVEVL